MNSFSQSESLAILLGSIVVGGFVFYCIFRWLQSAPVSPEPWDEEVEKSLQDPEATPVCHRCFTPHADDVWFCAHCGAAVGNYNNWMPYVYLFSEGEVLRNGVTTNIRPSPSVIVGYLFYSLFNYFIFAPVYWYFLFKNL